MWHSKNGFPKAFVTVSAKISVTRNLFQWSQDKFWSSVISKINYFNKDWKYLKFSNQTFNEMNMMQKIICKM